MAVPQGSSGASPSLFTSIRSFWGVLVAILYTRLDLAITELEETGLHAVQVVVISLAALLCVGLTIFFFLLFVIVLLWAHKEIVVGIIFGVCLIASISLVLIAREKILRWPKLLGQTLAELRRDAEGLRVAVKTGEKQ